LPGLEATGSNQILLIKGRALLIIKEGRLVKTYLAINWYSLEPFTVFILLQPI